MNELGQSGKEERALLDWGSGCLIAPVVVYFVAGIALVWCLLSLLESLRR